MTHEETIRAWKDPDYRATLGAEAQLALPQHPAGLVELSDSELMDVDGGTTIICVIVVITLLTIPTPAY